MQMDPVEIFGEVISGTRLKIASSCDSFKLPMFDN